MNAKPFLIIPDRVVHDKNPSYESTARLIVSLHTDLLQQHHHNPPIRQYCCTMADVMQPPSHTVPMLSRCCCHCACWFWLTGKHKPEKKLNNLPINKSAPTKFAHKYVLWRKRGQTTTQSEHARAPVWCKRTTAARSSKKQQHSVVLLRVLLLRWLCHSYDRGCMIRIMCETRRTYPICTET